MKILNIVKVQQWSEWYQAYEEAEIRIVATKKLTSRGAWMRLRNDYPAESLKGMEIIGIESMVWA